ncbi:MAG: hypothetical protein J6X35_01170, partial [Bacteroidales bacterium]|nr:hypothetical protein [Bacteroidales bacterium]
MEMLEENNNCQTIWNECLKIIRSNVAPEHFETWFQPIVPVLLKQQELTIQVPSMFYYEFIENNFWQVLKTAVRHVMGPDGKLAYSVVVQDDKIGKEKKTLTLPHSSTEACNNQSAMPPLPSGSDVEKKGREIVNPFVIPGLKSMNINSQLKPELNFDNFVEGECNRLARAAGFAVAKNPGKTDFNPLF